LCGDFLDWRGDTDLSQYCCSRGHTGSIYVGLLIAKKKLCGKEKSEPSLSYQACVQFPRRRRSCRCCLDISRDASWSDAKAAR
jgi:hypothetical protein